MDVVTLRAYILLGVAACMLATATGCQNSLPPSKPLAQLTPTEQSGRGVFQARCAVCHYPTSIRPLHGPGLQGLYKRPYLPSGAPANDDRISSTILHGRNNMPALGNQIDDQQLADLLAYLHTL